MLLRYTCESNPALIDFSLFLHNQGSISPDTYVVDMDAYQQNAQDLVSEAARNQITLYYMLKQLGRNPRLARIAQQIGFAGAVCVDFREALLYAREGLTLGNVGHLVQIPWSLLETILAAHPEIITVYSYAMCVHINDAAGRLGIVQDVMLRVWQEGDTVYPGQEAGFELGELNQLVQRLSKLTHIRVRGVCAFPCLLFDDKSLCFVPTHNCCTVQDAYALLTERGIEITQVNMPSGTCRATIPLLSDLGATHGEPGHGLSGSTPYHALQHAHTHLEKAAYVYVSEISHTQQGYSYCYGGGHYRRSHLKHALVGPTLADATYTTVHKFDPTAIDYYLTLDGIHPIGAPVVMAFRTQVFVTRSEVALVSGLSKGCPQLDSVWTSQGMRIR